MRSAIHWLTSAATVIPGALISVLVLPIAALVLISIWRIAYRVTP